MIFSIVVAGVFVFGALVGYASCVAAGRVDQNAEYFYLKMQEKEAKKRNENLKNE